MILPYPNINANAETKSVDNKRMWTDRDDKWTILCKPKLYDQ